MWVAPHLTSGRGNRLFQFAAAAGASEQWGYELVFYMPRCDKSPHGPLSSIFRMFPNIRMIEAPEDCIEYAEPGRRFYEYIPLAPKPTTNIVIKGFRQSPKYFPKELKPDWDSAIGPELCRHIQKLANLTTQEQRVRTYAIHVRLGDYRYLKHHQVDLSSYYTDAIQKLPPGSRLHLFSDEPSACQRRFQQIADKYWVEMTTSVTHTDVESLYEMSLCLGGTICANSTFSWWGAWFAHEAGAKWAIYPSSMGTGQPEPVDFYPEWAEVLKA